MDAGKGLFDRKFVAAACIVGCVYAAIVAGLGLISKEAAGVAGVALTALATAIFRQFETLRFRALADSEYKDISVTKENVFVLLMLVFAFLGVQMLGGMLLGLSIIALGLVPRGSSAMEGFYNLFNSWKFLAALNGTTFIALFGAAYCICRALPSLRYSTILFAVLGGAVVQMLLMLIPEIIKSPSSTLQFVLEVAPAAAFWLLHIAAALLGAWLSKRNLITRMVASAPQTAQAGPTANAPQAPLPTQVAPG